MTDKINLQDNEKINEPFKLKCLQEANAALHINDSLKKIIFVYSKPKVGSTSLVTSLRIFASTIFNIIHIHDEEMLKVLGNIHHITVNEIILYNKMIGKAKSGINSTELNKKANEEVENVDEVTSALLYRAKTAAQKKASWLMPGDKGKGDKAWNRVKKFRDAGVAKEKQEKQQKVAEDLDEALVKSSNGYYEVIHKGEKVGKYRQSNDARNHAAKLNEASTNNTNEVEELDELSKAAVGSYLKKSPQDLKNLEAGREKGESLPDHIRRNRMQNNRTVGIIRGVNKLTGNAKVPANKEVEELDEVGYTPQVRNKLRDYLVKAKNSGADAHMMYHTGRALGNEPDEDNVRELKNRSKGIRRAKERINRDMYREEVGFSEAEIARLEEIAKKFD